ncbi:ABC transporter substrate-binding protein [Parafrankia sp. EUN1f]|uniref:ABC transporter substrate-binding protein n=1 Tax=Parafrankia sp. EUN1f TaxID=102897 RepID=UPI0001C450EE|nr:extracellular solute-binding protein [Parafrankia sp. EUN1f]EFC86437.1 extracellular solute-binding protein family 1 [Parafrankia sp. EUN1f]
MRARQGRLMAMAGTAVLAMVLSTTSACGGDDGGKTKLTINTFGVFGYTDLYKEFEASHPDVEIVETVSEYNDHHNNLVNHLAAGSGAADVEAVDEGFIAQLKATPEQFVNLNDLGASDRESDYPAFKWSASLSADGKTQIGLGTDVGGLAMCYRTDLLEAAGLPSDPAAVSALWPTWDAYFKTGRDFAAKNTGVKFFDAGTNIYNAQIFQLDESYYATGTSDVIVGSNPKVKTAFDTTAKAISDGLSAGLVAFEDEWVTAMKEGTFATITCPAWMQGYIKENAPETAGKWNIAEIPGGSGNWGGSWLTIPAQSDHKDLAYELVSFLTAPEQQTRIFKETGNFPSSVTSIKDSAVQSFTNPFFDDAPTGKIFGESAISLEPQYQGSKHGAIRQAMEHGIQRIEQENQAADKAFSESVDEAERAAR